jgi:GNAT superfamily N-acetyltransferase
MITTLRTNSGNKDFISLVRNLDNELAILDGEEHDFYAQFNKIDFIKNVVIAYDANEPIACGAFKPFDQTAVEIKRMYTLQDKRGFGAATTVLMTLESWAIELGYKKSILETGLRQKAAIQLYLKNGYHKIPNYGQYEGVQNSLCFEKRIAQDDLNLL